MQLCYFSFWRGGGYAALLRVGYSNPSGILPRSGRCVSATAPACSRVQPRAAASSRVQPGPMDFGTPRRFQEALFSLSFF